MIARILNTLGLLIGIIGVCIIFRFGWPQPTFMTGTLIDFGGSQEHDKQIIAERALYQRRSTTGLIFIGVGFLFQLVAVWVPQRVHPPEKRTN